MSANTPIFTADDHAFMARALALAAQGLNTTTPNPRVGCVLTLGGELVGEGFHVRAGAPHAEVLALAQAGDRARGATAYVTLEPCDHHGRTPPCVDALIAAGVARVVAAMTDPNPMVAGRGLIRLAAAGIQVEQGLLASAAEELNIGFVSRMTRGRPWVHLKVAASLDGKTALSNGESQWITGPDARRDGHQWRARSCAILTGAGTVRDDDPQLTVREVECARVPMRVVVDGGLTTPPTARLLDGTGPVLIFHARGDAGRIAALAARGAEVIECADTEGRVDLARMLRTLASRGVNELLVEGGARLNGALLEARCVDELLMYFAPTLLGTHARGMFDFPALERLTSRHDVLIREVRQVGRDIRILARFQ